MGIFDFSSIREGLPEDEDFVGEKVFGERSARGPVDEVSLMGDIGAWAVFWSNRGKVWTEDCGDVCVQRIASLFPKALMF